jgi:hypothetical protein
MRSIRRGRIRAVATIGASMLAAIIAVGSNAGALTVASVPAYPGQTTTVGNANGNYVPSFGTPPYFLNIDGNGQTSASNIIRSAGSDTTLFMMQSISDLFNQAGLYGCGLQWLVVHRWKHHLQA